MKKFYVFLFAVILFTANVGKAEEAIPDSGHMVAATPATVYVTGTTQYPQTPKSVLHVKRGKSAFEKFANSITEAARSIGINIGEEKKAVNANTASLDKNAAASEKLNKTIDEKLIPEIKAAGEKVTTAVENVGNQSLLHTILIIAILLAVAFFFYRKIGSNSVSKATEKMPVESDVVASDLSAQMGKGFADVMKKLTSVEDEVLKTPTKTAKLNQLGKVLTFKNVDGKGLSVTVTPRIVNGEVLTLRVPDSVDVKIAYLDENIPRTPAKDLTHLAKTNETELKQFYGGVFDALSDEVSSLKLRTFKAALRNGEIIENK